MYGNRPQEAPGFSPGEYHEFRQFVQRVLAAQDARHAEHEVRHIEHEATMAAHNTRHADHEARMAAYEVRHAEHEARMAAHEARMAAHEARMARMDRQYDKLVQVQLALARSHDEHAAKMEQMRLTLEAIKELLQERRN